MRRWIDILNEAEVSEVIKRFGDWLESAPSIEIKTNKDVLDYASGNEGWVRKDALPAAERVAMMMAFELFNEIHRGAISSGAQSPHGCSWHEYYKKLALKAFDNAGGHWNERS